jgi:radical SAM superfamily enzyme YgiQ (UPF0313 family)
LRAFLTNSMNRPRFRENKKKHALLISPRQRGMGTSTDMLFPFPSLTLSTLAATFPEDYDVRVIDESVSWARGGEKADMVFITALTSAAPRAYHLADIYRKRGLPVVIGGVHATLQPEEAQEHATSVVTGEAENMVPHLLSDFERGALAPLYQNTHFSDFNAVLYPALHLLNWRHRFFISPLQTSRGCPKDCDFCCVPRISGSKLRLKSLAAVEKELVYLSRFRSRTLFIVDDNFTLKKERCLEIIKLFRRFGFRWMAFSNLSVSEDEDYMKALGESGCISLFIGFESLHRHFTKNRSFKTPEAVARAIKMIHKHGIGIQGAFIFGFDEDTPEVVRETVSFIQETGIDLPTISLLTPFPGTPLFDELEQKGRILHKDWSYYDMNHVVFRPENMTSEELQQGYAWALKYLASPTSIIARINKKSAAKAYFLTINFALHCSQTRIARRLWNPRVQTSMQERNLCLC